MLCGAALCIGLPMGKCHSSAPPLWSAVSVSEDDARCSAAVDLVKEGRKKKEKKKNPTFIFFHCLLWPEEEKTGNLWDINTWRNVFVSVREGKQQSRVTAGWQMREDRKCDWGNNIWIRRHESQSNGCFGLGLKRHCSRWAICWRVGSPKLQRSLFLF